MGLAAGAFERALKAGEAKPPLPAPDIDQQAADRKAVECIDNFIAGLTAEIILALENPGKRAEHGKTAGMLRIAMIQQRGSERSYDTVFPANQIRELPAYDPLRLSDPRVALPSPLLHLLERVQRETGRNVRVYLEIDASGNWSTNDELWIYLEKK